MDGEKELRALEARLGTDAPPGLAQLSGEQLHDLLSAVDDARHRQAAQLQAAGDQAFRHVPRLLRVPILRIMR